jgi:hypothetical protein
MRHGVAMSFNKALARFRFEPSSDVVTERAQRERDNIAQRLSTNVVLSGVFIAGLKNDAGIFSDGIAFGATGSTTEYVEIPHGFGRPCLGFVVCDAQDNPADGIVRVASTTGLEKSHIRLRNTSASATRIKVMVY